VTSSVVRHLWTKLQRLSTASSLIRIGFWRVTGLRRSEIRGLKWEDVDFDRLWLNLRRGIVRNLQTKLKTEGSRKGVPIPPGLAEELKAWRNQSLYRADDDWIIA